MTSLLVRRTFNHGFGSCGVTQARESGDKDCRLKLYRVAVVPIRIVGDPVLRIATEPVPVARRRFAAGRSRGLDQGPLRHDGRRQRGRAGRKSDRRLQAGVRLRLRRRARPHHPSPRCRRQPGAGDVRSARDHAGPGQRRRGLPVGSRRVVPDGPGDWARVTGLDADGTPITIEGTDLFARMLQHETGHLDGFLYLDRLVGRHARSAKRAVKSHGWGVPGLSWTPGKDPDPFGH